MHRLTLASALIVGALGLPATAVAQEGNRHLQAFGGLTVRGIGAAPTFGGSVAFPLSDSVQVIAEGGRLTDIMSPALSTLLDLTPVDVRLSALYGEAGVRVIAPPHRHLRPYAEATAGLARMKTSFAGVGPRPDLFVNTALRFLDRTDPLLGLGAGVVVQTGPVFVDLGYRYNKIVNSSVVQEVLSGGDLGVNQFRLGLGVSF
jgi:hypothetical protein